jgi:hypothetical protein
MERVDLPVLVLPLAGGWNSLAGLPRSARPQRPVATSAQFSHPLS